MGADGYGLAFWTAYPDVGGLADQRYYGLAAPIPILGVLVLALAIAGFVRAAPGPSSRSGLVIALAVERRPHRAVRGRRGGRQLER